MQTFLPYPDFNQSARVLSRQHLGCQRKEAKQILRTLLGDPPGSGWYNHVVVRMWRGHERALARYGAAICMEWIRRGYMDTQLAVFDQMLQELPPSPQPPWLGAEALHRSYRAALLAKNPERYSQFNWAEPPGIAYAWPAPLLSVR
jgi:hypothetical protein